MTGKAKPVIKRLRARKEWKFAGVLVQADRALAVAWWTLLALRGVLPALFAIAMGGLVESGTHEALMAKGGQYAQLYRIQAAAYR